MKIINAQIRELTKMAVSLARVTSSDSSTNMHFEGKIEGYRKAVNRTPDTMRRLRDDAHAESLRQWFEVRDPWQYQYFCGVASAANDVIALHAVGG